MREAMRAVVNEHLDAGDIVEVMLENGDKAYVEALLMQDFLGETQVKILSPFDNVLIHRERLSALFGFDFRIECYVPAAKRQFGYFCLPILYGDCMVGRIDCKAHRRSKVLQVLSVHWESKTKRSEQLLALLQAELLRFSQFNQCTELDDAVLKKALA